MAGLQAIQILRAFRHFVGRGIATCTAKFGAAAPNVAARVTAINFIFDTLLFDGMMFIIATAISRTGPASIDTSGICAPADALSVDRSAEPSRVEEAR
ncbi:MAG TPA: hypothetical protein VH277_06335 [Gemmatimonadaceae bacterium]|jgi:hypothetical protein|nr:hypothetical protein [Gemmatimonadaceae bacterium]